jgi:ATP-dependent Clp protease ATP-binding subunit ClpA
MSLLFRQYSARAKRVIFWAHLYAREAQAREITTEHILFALLKEDPELFPLVLPGVPDIVNQIQRELDSCAENPNTPRIVEGVPAQPRLSALAKMVVAGAGLEQQRLGHKIVATQHLLLAMVTAYEQPRKHLGLGLHWPVRRKWYEASAAQRVLLKYGINAENVYSKTQEGIITTSSGVCDDSVIKLNAQLTAMAELMISKGIFSRSEWVALLDQNEDPIEAATFLAPVVNALFQKGTVTAVEKAKFAD